MSKYYTLCPPPPFPYASFSNALSPLSPVTLLLIALWNLHGQALYLGIVLNAVLGLWIYFLEILWRLGATIWQLLAFILAFFLAIILLIIALYLQQNWWTLLVDLLWLLLFMAILIWMYYHLSTTKLVDSIG